MLIQPFRPTASWRGCWIAAVLSAWVLAWTAAALAENDSKRPPVEKGASQEDPLPPEEAIDLLARDGVHLKATFYPGGEDTGKETVPVILLHMFKGNRKDYARLALYLQQQGHAVLVPDLRGHGESTQVQGTTRKLEARSMPPRAFAAMAIGDMEACKSFLISKNNEGELNIDKLCLIGAEMGSVVAMDWALLDWSWPVLVTGKQGQDVKTVILLSPQWSFRSLQVRPILSQPAVLSRISIMIVVGKKNSRAAREAKRLHSTLKRSHPKADDKDPTQRTLIFLKLPTSLQGTKMLDAPELKVAERIALFIKLRLTDQSIPWKKRKTIP